MHEVAIMSRCKLQLLRGQAGGIGSLRFPTWTIMLSVTGVSLTSSFPICVPFSFVWHKLGPPAHCGVVWGRSRLSRSQPHGTAFSLSPYSVLAVVSLWIPFIRLRKFPSVASWRRIFITKGYEFCYGLVLCHVHSHVNGKPRHSCPQMAGHQLVASGGSS